MADEVCWTQFGGPILTFRHRFDSGAGTLAATHELTLNGESADDVDFDPAAQTIDPVEQTLHGRYLAERIDQLRFRGATGRTRATVMRLEFVPDGTPGR